MCHIHKVLWSAEYDKNYTESTRELINLGEIITTELHQQYPDHYHLKSHFVSIIPHGKQIRHVDNHFYHGCALRLVVPIITTPFSLHESRIVRIPFTIKITIVT